jgi:hypothetical protein
VKIYIIIWSETKFALNLSSERAKTTLEALHRNITVICHPVLLMKWSHHQKTVVGDKWEREGEGREREGRGRGREREGEGGRGRWREKGEGGKGKGEGGRS